MHQHHLGFEPLGQLRQAQSVEQTFLQGPGALQQGQAWIVRDLLTQLVESFTRVQLTLTETKGGRRR